MALRSRLFLVIAAIATITVVAWSALGCLAMIAGEAVVGVGVLAYFIGVRHGFDADHIAAIDNVTRKLRQDGQRPVATGLFFALGHSTIVVLLSMFVAIAVRSRPGKPPLLGILNGIVGVVVSAVFLSVIGIINLLIFFQLWRALRGALRADNDATGFADNVRALLDRRGLMGRILGFVYRHVDASWKMYPVGVLFGLGFDTATEVAILGISATAAASGKLPIWGVMVFPLLFTAGMSFVDALDGAVMMRVYDWAFADAARKLFFNTVITGLSVLIALAVAGIEWLQIVGGQFQLAGWFWNAIESFNNTEVGVVIVALMMLTWLLAWRQYRRYFAMSGA
ncbi:MAG: HoxN/HupN/NixA family nickel/cobalt transporter [Deltaproteobacteria bacterium]|nr:HoxN/HupN/NixA family nickel/cobalt transporter [Deltaproteobacteria bacterium]